MAQNREVIRQAMEELGVIALGREPTNAQATRALKRLEDLVKYLSEPPMAPAWIDQTITSDVTAEENDRLRVNSETPVTIYLPISTQPRHRVIDECGCITIEYTCRSDRAPNDKSRVAISDVFGTIDPVTYIYRIDRSEWIKATGMTLDQECPFADTQGLVAMLAIKLAPSYDAEIPAAVGLNASRGLWTSTYSTISTPTDYF